mmetsp:Transcript_30747/g.102428  ORF Transcript_30747/g.102428 Transcript_30747/m.102428 type:complete len:603 (-) Transcript_30747:54-1862(-)
MAGIQQRAQALNSKRQGLLGQGPLSPQCRRPLHHDRGALEMRWGNAAPLEDFDHAAWHSVAEHLERRLRMEDARQSDCKLLRTDLRVRADVVHQFRRLAVLQEIGEGREALAQLQNVKHENVLVDAVVECDRCQTQSSSARQVDAMEIEGRDRLGSEVVEPVHSLREVVLVGHEPDLHAGAGGEPLLPEGGLLHLRSDTAGARGLRAAAHGVPALGALGVPTLLGVPALGALGSAALLGLAAALRGVPPLRRGRSKGPALAGVPALGGAPALRRLARHGRGAVRAGQGRGPSSSQEGRLPRLLPTRRCLRRCRAIRPRCLATAGRCCRGRGGFGAGGTTGLLQSRKGVRAGAVGWRVFSTPLRQLVRPQVPPVPLWRLLLLRLLRDRTPTLAPTSRAGARPLARGLLRAHGRASPTIPAAAPRRAATGRPRACWCLLPAAPDLVVHAIHAIHAAARAAGPHAAASLLEELAVCRLSESHAASHARHGCSHRRQVANRHRTARQLLNGCCREVTREPIRQLVHRHVDASGRHLARGHLAGGDGHRARRELCLKVASLIDGDHAAHVLHTCLHAARLPHDCLHGYGPSCSRNKMSTSMLLASSC